MSTDLKAVLSKRNPYRISKEKYYELKHFCKQYDEWRRYCDTVFPRMISAYGVDVPGGTSERPIEEACLKLEKYKEYMSLVDLNLIDAAGPIIAKYLKLTVTQGYSYDALAAAERIPCGRELYYKYYREFFYLLAKER